KKRCASWISWRVGEDGRSKWGLTGGMPCHRGVVPLVSQAGRLCHWVCGGWGERALLFGTGLGPVPRFFRVVRKRLSWTQAAPWGHSKGSSGLSRDDDRPGTRLGELCHPAAFRDKFEDSA